MRIFEKLYGENIKYAVTSSNIYTIQDFIEKNEAGILINSFNVYNKYVLDCGYNYNYKVYFVETIVEAKQIFTEFIYDRLSNEDLTESLLLLIKKHNIEIPKECLDKHITGRIECLQYQISNHKNAIEQLQNDIEKLSSYRISIS